MQFPNASNVPLINMLYPHDFSAFEMLDRYISMSTRDLYGERLDRRIGVPAFARLGGRGDGARWQTSRVQIRTKVSFPPIAAGRRCDPRTRQSISYNLFSITASHKTFVTACKSQDLCTKLDVSKSGKNGPHHRHLYYVV
jgi:hypothetical protein